MFFLISFFQFNMTGYFQTSALMYPEQQAPYLVVSNCMWAHGKQKWIYSQILKTCQKKQEWGEIGLYFVNTFKPLSHLQS